MSLSNSNTWFGNWAPPQAILPHLFPESVHDIRYPQRNNYQEQSGSTMNTFIPYLLALGTITPSSTVENPPQKLINIETTGPFRTVYRWKQIDYEFPSEADRIEAISSERFIQKNNLPLGIESWEDRIFISMPKWKPGVPATLTWLPKNSIEESPKLRPYPNWRWHMSGSCAGLTSVFRMQIDTCGRLWVLDSGQVHVTIKAEQLCPPQIVIFDLNTNKLIRRHVLPKEFIKEDSLYTNIAIDTRNNDCEDSYAYVTDVWRFGLVVYSFEKDRSWRVTNNLFYPDPIAAAYNLHDLKFRWTDGIFGLSLGPYNKNLDDRLLFFHPMSSFREFNVPTSVIRNETGWEDLADQFRVVGQSRGRNGHASASAMDANGILFFNSVSKDSVSCWDSRKSYQRDHLGVVAQSNITMIFPNDLRLDKEKRRGIWIVTNRLPFYLYKSLDENDYNFRIMHAFIDQAIKGTICDPQVISFESSPNNFSETDCY